MSNVNFGPSIPSTGSQRINFLSPKDPTYTRHENYYTLPTPQNNAQTAIICLASESQTITGNKTFTGTNSFTGNVSMSGTLSHTGNTTQTGNLTVTGNITATDNINAANVLKILTTSNQLVFSIVQTTTINVPTPSANRIYTINDAGSDSTILTGTSAATVLSSSLDTTLSASQSGQVFFLRQQTANNTITLPAIPSSGSLNFKFIVTATANGTNTCTISSATAGKMTGHIIGPTSDADIVTFADKDSVILSATAANVKPGDYMECWSAGGTVDRWFCRCVSAGTAVGWSAP